MKITAQLLVLAVLLGLSSCSCDTRAIMGIPCSIDKNGNEMSPYHFGKAQE